MAKFRIGSEIGFRKGTKISFIRQYFHIVTSKNLGTTGLSFGPCSVFNIYINDIDDAVSSKILKFADDTKLSRAVTNQDDIGILRSDLVNLCHWSQVQNITYR